MAKKDLTGYQKDVISRYYDNIGDIKLQRLQELVTELYLADKPSKKERLWEQVHKAMITLKVKPAIINHIMEKKSAEILAKNLQDWLKKPSV